MHQALCNFHVERVVVVGLPMVTPLALPITTSLSTINPMLKDTIFGESVSKCVFEPLLKLASDVTESD